LENVPKLIIDAFSGWQIDRDRSAYPKVKIYKDDHLRWVRAIHVEGEFTHDEDDTEVWIFGKNKLVFEQKSEKVHVQKPSVWDNRISSISIA